MRIWTSRSTRLARHLQSVGVGPESLVGLCLERGLEMVVGVLGVLKAGGAYVPLDPAFPAERLRYMLEDSGAKALVTRSGSVRGVAFGTERGAGVSGPGQRSDRSAKW